MAQTTSPRSSQAQAQANARREALKRVMRVYDVNPTAWAAAAGIGKNNIYNFLNGHTASIGTDILTKLAAAIDVPTDALLGKVPYDSLRAIRLLKAKALSEESAARLLRVPEETTHPLAPSAARGYGARGGSGSEEFATGASIVEIDVRAGLGGGGEAGSHPVNVGGIMHADDIKAVWNLPEAYVRTELRASPAAVRIVEVIGDSMSPTLESGDRVAINTEDINPSPPGVFALWDGFGLVIKRLERIFGSDRLRVISDNPAHQIVELAAEEIRIVGRACWRAHRL